MVLISLNGVDNHNIPDFNEFEYFKHNESFSVLRL